MTVIPSTFLTQSSGFGKCAMSYFYRKFTIVNKVTVLLAMVKHDMTRYGKRMCHWNVYRITGGSHVEMM